MVKEVTTLAPRRVEEAFKAKSAYLDAITKYPLLNLVDPAILEEVGELFATEDRRTANVYRMLGFLLTQATIEQKTLFHEMCDVAVITIKNYKHLRSFSEWQWCHETTCKMMKIFLVKKYFIKAQQQRGKGTIYYFPLRRLNVSFSEEDLQSLQHAWSKLRRSQVVSRLQRNCSGQQLDKKEQAGVVESSLVDQREQQSDDVGLVGQATTALSDLLKQHGITVSPALGREIQQTIEQHFVKPLFGRLLGSADLSSQQPPICFQTDHFLPRNEEKRVRSTILSSSDLPNGSKLADPSYAYTHIIRDENIFEENMHKSEVDSSPNLSTSHAKGSDISLDPLADPSSLACYFADVPLASMSVEEYALDLSARFPDPSGNDYTPLFRRLRREMPRELHCAVVDALWRTIYRDAGHEQDEDELGGGWVVKKCRAYGERNPVPPEVLSWAQTGYSYDLLLFYFEADRAWQLDKYGCIMRRSSFYDLLFDGSTISSEEFQQQGGAQGLERSGYQFVSFEGKLFTCQQYECYQRSLDSYTRCQEDLQFLQKHLDSQRFSIQMMRRSRTRQLFLKVQEVDAQSDVIGTWRLSRTEHVHAFLDMVAENVASTVSALPGKETENPLNSQSIS